MFGRDDLYGPAYAEAARDIAKEDHRAIQITNWVFVAFWALVLAGMAYFNVSLKWMLVATFVGITVTISGLIRWGLYRLDVSRLYLERSVDELRARDLPP